MIDRYHNLCLLFVVSRDPKAGEVLLPEISKKDGVPRKGAPSFVIS